MKKIRITRRKVRCCTVGLSLAGILLGCGGQYNVRQPERVVQYQKDPKIVEYMETESYRKFKNIYGSVDLSNLSSKERAWLRNIDKSELVKELKTDFEPQQKEFFELFFDIKKPTDRDLIALHRYFKPFKENAKAVLLFGGVRRD